MPLDVGCTHIDDAGIAKTGTDRCGGDAVLTGPGLGNDPRLAHAAGEQDLADAVIDLVRAGMVQLVALEIDLGPAEMLGQPFREIERAGPSHIVGHVAAHLGMEGRIVLGVLIGLTKVKHEGHEGLGHIAATIVAKAAIGVGIGGVVIRRLSVHADLPSGL